LARSWGMRVWAQLQPLEICGQLCLEVPEPPLHVYPGPKPVDELMATSRQ